MTTQINVIVDNGGLSEKAKRQTQANRWSKLESDNRQKVEQQGLQQRDAERLLSGIGTNGRPLYGATLGQPVRRDEPAAYRSASTKVDALLIPHLNYNADYTVPLKTKTSSFQYFSDASIYNGVIALPSQQFFVSLADGPLGSGCLALPQKQVQVFTAHECSGAFVTSSNGPAYGVGYSDQASGVGGQIHYSMIKDASGTILPSSTKLKAKDIESLTIEFMLKVGDNDAGTGSENNTVSVSVETNIYDQISALVAPRVRRRLQLITELYWLSYNRSPYQGAGYLGYSGEFNMYSGTADAGDFWDFSGSRDGSQTWQQRNPGKPEPLFNKWVHFAVVKNKLGFRWFIAGQEVYSALFANLPGGSTAESVLLSSGTDSFDGPVIDSIVRLYSKVSNTPPVGGLFRYTPCYLHGLRVTSKEVYKADFTPPSRITSFA